MSLNRRTAIAEAQQKRLVSDRALRLRVARSHWGRNYSWRVEFRGQCVAILSDQKTVDLNFWDTCKVTFMTEDPEIRALLDTREFWNEDEVDYRNSELDLICSSVFASTRGVVDGRIGMKFFCIRPPLTWLDRCVLFFDRFARKKREGRSE